MARVLIILLLIAIVLAWWYLRKKRSVAPLESLDKDRSLAELARARLADVAAASC